LTVTDALEALLEDGISNLEQLVGRELERARSRADQPDVLNLYAVPADPPRTTHELRHRPPRMAVKIDGMIYYPPDIRRFDGQPLHLVYVPSARDGATLQGFTGSGWAPALRTYFQVRDLLSVLDVSPADEPFEPFFPPPPTEPLGPYDPG